MSNINMFDTKTFCDVFEDFDTFHDVYRSLPTSFQALTEGELETTYYLLYGQYGNSSIASYDENRFIYKLFSIIMTYGPYWAKQLEIQKELRGLKTSDILAGSKVINSHAFDEPLIKNDSSLEDTESQHIDSQSVTTYKKTKMDAYQQYLSLLDTDYTEAYLRRFKKLFITIIEPYNDVFYESEE